MKIEKVRRKAMVLAIFVVLLASTSSVVNAQISIVDETGKSDAIYTRTIGDLTRFRDITVKGGLAVAADGGCTSSSAAYALDLKIPTGAAVQNAYLYIPFYNLDGKHEYEIVFDGNNLGDARDHVIAENDKWQQNCRFDVTRYVKSSKIYIVKANKIGGLAKVYGATLVVIYTNKDPSTRIIINEGCVYIGVKESYTTNFRGIDSTGKTASLWVVASGTNEGESDILYFNGNPLGADVFDESTGKNFDTDNYDVSSYLKTDNFVKFEVINDPFWADVAILGVSYPNQPPTATIDSITPDPAEQEKDTVSFTGHGTDSDGSVVAYNWRSSINGQLSTSASFTKPASELSVGTHTIYFKVQDDDGAWSTEVSEDLTINPANLPPTAVIDSITPDPAEQEKDTVSFTGHGTDSDGSVVAYNWRSSINGQLSTSASFTKPASELSVGTHTIYFKVQDDDGAWSKQEVGYVTVKAAKKPPVAKFTYSPELPLVDEKITFDASSSNDTDGFITKYEWDFGDGRNATGEVVTHAYSEAGGYTVTLTVTDDDGAKNSTTKTVAVSEEPTQTQTVSISTDKTEYHPGETMNITIRLENPRETAEQLFFGWYLVLPDSGYWQKVMSSELTLPEGFDESFSVPLRVGYWAPVKFNATWYVVLLNTTTYEIISEDGADWKYIPKAKTTQEAEAKARPEEIAEEIAKELEGVEFAA